MRLNVQYSLPDDENKMFETKTLCGKQFALLANVRFVELPARISL